MLHVPKRGVGVNQTKDSKTGSIFVKPVTFQLLDQKVNKTLPLNNRCQRLKYTLFWVISITLDIQHLNRTSDFWVQRIHSHTYRESLGGLALVFTMVAYGHTHVKSLCKTFLQTPVRKQHSRGKQINKQIASKQTRRAFIL